MCMYVCMSVVVLGVFSLYFFNIQTDWGKKQRIYCIGFHFMWQMHPIIQLCQKKRFMYKRKQYQDVWYANQELIRVRESFSFIKFTFFSYTHTRPLPPHPQHKQCLNFCFKMWTLLFCGITKLNKQTKNVELPAEKVFYKNIN